MATQRGSSRAFAMLLVAMGLPLGCSDDEAVVGCYYELCAIEDPSCVAAMTRVVACKTGYPMDPPEVRYLSASEVVAEMLAGSPELTAEEQRLREDVIESHALVGLMPDGYEPSQLTADSIAYWVAFYSTTTKQVTIITDKVTDDPQLAFAVLVHELVHAGQDARYDLESFRDTWATTHDRWLGAIALSEGEAVFYADLAILELEEIDVDDVDWRGYFDSWQTECLERAAATDTPVLDVRGLFPYAFGGELVLDAWRGGGAQAVAELYAQPPDSVRMVMGGYGAWPDGRPNGDAQLRPVAAPKLPAGYTSLAGEFAGTWLINAMMQRTVRPARWHGQVDRVPSDFLSYFRVEADDTTAAVWRIRHESAAYLQQAFLQSSASLWIDAAGSLPPAGYLQSFVDGDLLLVAAGNGDAAGVANDIEGWQPPASALTRARPAASVRFWQPHDVTWLARRGAP